MFPVKTEIGVKLKSKVLFHNRSAKIGALILITMSKFLNIQYLSLEKGKNIIFRFKTNFTNFSLYKDLQSKASFT